MLEKIKLSFQYILSFSCHYLGIDRLYRIIFSPMVVILTFHRVAYKPDPLLLSVSEKKLENICSILKERKLISTLDDALDSLMCNHRKLSYVLTFDDGYRDNITLLHLAKEGVPSIIYIATSFIGEKVIWPFELIYCLYNTERTKIDLSEIGYGQILLDSLGAKRESIVSLNMWLKQFPSNELNKKVSYICKCCGGQELPLNERMLTLAELFSLEKAGVSIAGHTRSHAILTKLPLEQSLSEITGSHGDIKRYFPNKHHIHFAYPNGGVGDFNEDIKKQVEQAGFRSAVSTVFGVNRKYTDFYALRRVPVCDTSFLSPFGKFSECRFFSETSGLPGLLKELYTKWKIQ